MSVQDLYWTGQQSYMRALKASLVFSENVTTRPPDGYTWVDRDGVAPSYGSGEVGQTIFRQQWREEFGNATYIRDLSFDMWPKNFDRDDNLADAKAWAKEYGWSLWGVSALDNVGDDIAWLDSMMHPNDQPTLVQTPTSDDLFDCNYYEQFLFNQNGVMATFKAENILFGAFLPGGYDVGTLGRYRPCEYKYPGARCEAINGVIFCDGTKLESGDLGPDDGTKSPTVTPTASPTTDQDPITIDWQSDRSYMFGRNVETTLEGQTDYCFTGETSVKLTSGSGNGPLVDRTWNEDCHNRKRRVYFKSSQYPNSNGGGFVLNEGKINNENGNARLHWSVDYGSFVESQIILPDNDNWDAWTCEHVEFNFSNEDAGKLPGKFVADDFVIAMFLDKNYDADNLSLFNPCHHIDECLDKDCTCNTVDGSITCSDSSGNNYPVSSDDVTSMSTVSSTLSAGSHNDLYIRIRLIFVALSIGALALI